MSSLPITKANHHKINRFRKKAEATISPLHTKQQSFFKFLTSSASDDARSVQEMNRQHKCDSHSESNHNGSCYHAGFPLPTQNQREGLKTLRLAYCWKSIGENSKMIIQNLKTWSHYRRYTLPFPLITVYKLNGQFKFTNIEEVRVGLMPKDYNCIWQVKSERTEHIARFHRPPRMLDSRGKKKKKTNPLQAS